MDVSRGDSLPSARAVRGPVVVGVDRSPVSGEALRYALRTAAMRGADVAVVAASPLPLPWADGRSGFVPDPLTLHTATVEATRSFVDAIVGEVSTTLPDPTAPPPVRIDVAEGPAGPLLVQRSREAQLLVVGHRGRGRGRSALLGSAALHCAAAARCPVVVVRPRSEVPAGRPLVVVGVDGSAHSRAALVRAIDEADRLGARIEAIATYQTGDEWTELYSFLAPSFAGLRADVERGVRLFVDDVLGSLRRPEGAAPVSIRTDVAEGPAADVLIDRSHTAALLVVGSRGLGVVRGLLLGSVALRCVTSAACPVMVVHRDQDAPAAVAGADAGRRVGSASAAG